MQVLKKAVANSNFWPLLVVLLLGVLASRTLLFQSGYFVMHDDLQMMRQLQLEKCFLDGQIPCRWVPDMGFGYGFPLFNFYPPLPYLVGQIFRLAGFSFVSTAKIAFSLSMILSGFTMYFFSKEFFGRWGGLLSSALYIWAPYHAVDVYVRGAMNESWALVWFPIILWSSYILITDSFQRNVTANNLELNFIVKNREKLKWMAVLSLSYCFLFLSHNLMVLIFSPVFVGWVILHLWMTARWKRALWILGSAIWAIGLASFFFLPMLFEQKLVNLFRLTQGYLSFTAHFLSLRQLFLSGFWGYGNSEWGIEADGMSFQIGYLHWILSLIAVALLVYWLINSYNKKEGIFINVISKLKRDKVFSTVSYMLIVFGVSVVMMHNISTKFWLLIPQLNYVQFPWRYLSIVIFTTSFIAGAVVLVVRDLTHKKSSTQKNFTAVVVVPLILLVMLLNWNYFLPKNGEMGALSDEQKFAGLAWELQQKAGNSDYLPKSASEVPQSAPEMLFEITEGEGDILSSGKGTDWAVAEVDISSEYAVVRLSIPYFPFWKASVDGQEAEIIIPADEVFGQIHTKVPIGTHKLHYELHDTPVRNIGNLLTALSWSLLVLVGTVLLSSRSKRYN